MSTFFAVYANLFQFIFQHSRSARFLPIILSIIKAIAPSPVTLQAVPKRIPIVWNVVNWIFITLKTRRISQLLSGFTVVVWKAEINLSQKN